MAKVPVNYQENNFCSNDIIKKDQQRKIYPEIFTSSES